MRIAVTGASGFIGGHLVAHLEARGDAVGRVARPFVRDTLSAAFAGVDVVVHVAGVVSAMDERAYVDGNVTAMRITRSPSRRRDTSCSVWRPPAPRAG